MLRRTIFGGGGHARAAVVLLACLLVAIPAPPAAEDWASALEPRTDPAVNVTILGSPAAAGLGSGGGHVGVRAEGVVERADAPGAGQGGEHGSHASSHGGSAGHGQQGGSGSGDRAHGTSDLKPLSWYVNEGAKLYSWMLMTVEDATATMIANGDLTQGLSSESSMLHHGMFAINGWIAQQDSIAPVSDFDEGGICPIGATLRHLAKSIRGNRDAYITGNRLISWVHGSPSQPVHGGPQYQARIQQDPALAAPEAGIEAPPLEDWSDVAFLDYRHIVPLQDPLVLTKVFQVLVTDSETLWVIQWLLTGQPLGTGEWVDPPYHRPKMKQVSPDSEGFQALLGTPSGQQVAKLLIMHKRSFGRLRIKSIGLIKPESKKKGVVKRPVLYYEIVKVKGGDLAPPAVMDAGPSGAGEGEGAPGGHAPGPAAPKGPTIEQYTEEGARLYLYMSQSIEQVTADMKSRNEIWDLGDSESSLTHPDYFNEYGWSEQARRELQADDFQKDGVCPVYAYMYRRYAGHGTASLSKFLHGTLIARVHDTSKEGDLGSHIPASDARYVNIYNPAEGIIYAAVAQSPQSKIPKVGAFTNDVYNLPYLQHWSDVAFIDYLTLIPAGERPKLHQIFQVQVKDAETRKVIQWILTKRPLGTGAEVDVPSVRNKRTLNPRTPEFKALLGTPSGKQVAQLLITHKGELGILRVNFINIFRADSGPREPVILYEVALAEDRWIPQQGAVVAASPEAGGASGSGPGPSKPLGQGVPQKRPGPAIKERGEHDVIVERAVVPPPGAELSKQGASHGERHDDTSATLPVPHDIVSER